MEDGREEEVDEREGTDGQRKGGWNGGSERARERARERGSEGARERGNEGARERGTDKREQERVESDRGWMDGGKGGREEGR